MSAIPPDQVLERLKSGVRPQKQRNLDIIHAVCRELHGLGSSDFSLATVGRMSEARHGMSRNALYNKASEDFLTLISAWSAFAGEPLKKQPSPLKPLAEDALLRRIDDPALRSLFGGIVAERNRLRREANLLKRNASVVIDRRTLPGHTHVTTEGRVTQVLPPLANLTESETAALRKALSPEFLAQEGWREETNGEILNAKGRILFDVGFANAVSNCLPSKWLTPNSKLHLLEEADERRREGRCQGGNHHNQLSTGAVQTGASPERPMAITSKSTEPVPLTRPQKQLFISS